MWSRYKFSCVKRLVSFVSVYGRTGMAEDRERVVRLETRAKEAENALQQLRAYIELLKKKAVAPVNSTYSEETKQLEKENALLKAEVTELKQKLVVQEIRNGVPQVPVPSSGAKPPPKVTFTSSQETPTITRIEQAMPTQTTQPQQAQTMGGDEVKDNISKKKNDKGGKRDKGPPAPELPVDVSRLDFRIGKIVHAWKHPDADGLYVEEVDVGEGKQRTVCSGLTKHIPLEQMQERVAIFLCNLKPAKMRGVFSAAMVMCASTPDKVEILDPPPGCQAGDRVYCEGFEGTPDTVLNPKKKVFETVQPDLHTNKEGVACYKDIPFSVEGRDGVFRAATLKETSIR